MGETTTESWIQRRFGTGSAIFAVIQVVLFILAVTIPRDAPVEIFVIFAQGILVFSLIGISLGFAGLTRNASDGRKTCNWGIVSNVIITFIALFTTAVITMVEYG